MKIALSLEEGIQDNATNQVDSQGKQSAREGAAHRGRKLSEVLQGVETALPAAANSLEIRQVACDSRKVRPGALFLALHGAKGRKQVHSGRSKARSGGHCERRAGSPQDPEGRG